MSGAHLSLGDGREFDAIRAMLDEWGPRATGVGDDAATLEMPSGAELVVSTDASVEGVHFRRAWMSASEIGARAATAALSDLAAMAAAPLGMLLSLVVPERWQNDLLALARGVGVAAASAGCPIVGGNLTRGSELSVTITVLGHASSPLRRAGARSGDRVYVTGWLGGPGAALRALLASETPAAAHLARFIAPVPRLREAQWLAKAGARAAIDISDGLLADAAHLARASGVTLAIDLGRLSHMDGVTAAQAATSGEEYELLITVPADVAVDVGQFVRTFGIPLTDIGSVQPAVADAVLIPGDGGGLAHGHDHLR
ncbi:MAG: thiamine-phosphate kinase [Gemmatimonadaceae bacterium]